MLKGSTNEEKIWNFLKGAGLNDCGAAGLMGNLYAESGLRIYFTGFLFAGVNMVTAAFFSASDKTVQGFVLSLLRGVIAVPPILFPLAWALGVDGVWMTFPMVELVTAVAALVWARKYIIEN